MLKYYQKKTIWLALFIFWTLLLIILSVYPNYGTTISEGESNFRLDYLEHFVAYFVFGGLYIIWRSNADFIIKSIELGFLFSITCLFSILTEYVQVVIPGRSFNIIDILYNAGGVLTGILITYFLLIRIYLKRRYERQGHDINPAE